MRRVKTTVQATGLVVLSVAVLAAVSVTAASGSALEKGTPPHGLPAFYGVPDPLPSTTPGTVIKTEKITAPKVDGTTYRIMYVSEDTMGKPIAVTGTVIVPNTAPPKGGYHVVAWAHGTNGMAPQCAPSLHPGTTTTYTAVPYADQLLAQNWLVVASDYQGEGTPGPLPYLVGSLAARNTLDIVRAVHRDASFHASSTYAVWGHSEGGQTALFSLHLAHAYAPTLHLVGVVAGAPPSQFNLVYAFLKTSKFRFYLLMAAGGFNTAYGNKAAPLTEVMTKQAQQLLPDLEKGCFTYLENTLDKYQITQMVKGDPFLVPAWHKLLAENDPENFTQASSAPLLIPQGGTDTQIPVASTKILFTHLCKIGQSTERWIYPGQSHAGVIQYYMGDMVHWLEDRFAGDPEPDPYSPAGLPGVTTTVCAGTAGGASVSS
jgi:dipeptidyl aminopeptidase/acylaminoacyl peptidase